jgi:hypothetical protein
MNMPERVEFNYSNSIGFFDSAKLLEEFDRQVSEAGFVIKPEESLPQIRKVYETANNRFNDVYKTITDTASTDKARYFEIRTLRNYCYHMGVDGFLQFLDESTNQEHRQMMIEALGWFILSVEKAKIVEAITKISEDGSEPEAIQKEVKKTLLRLI